VVVIDIEPIRERFSAVAPFLDERGRRLVAQRRRLRGLWRDCGGRDGDRGCADTIGRGLKELASDEPSERIRRPELDAVRTVSKDHTLLHDLEALVEPTTRGDPESPLRWTLQKRAPAGAGAASPGSRGQPHPGRPLAHEAGYSLQGNRKTKRATVTPTGMRSSATSNTQVTTALAEQQPVISVDTKKRNWSGISVTTGANIGPKATRKRSGSMTS